MRKRLKYDNLITVIFLAVLAVTLTYNLMFQSGSKLQRILLIFGTVAVTKVFFSITFLKRSKATYTAVIIFIIISMYMGNVLNFYTYVSSYDKILHLTSGVIKGIIGVIIYAYFTKGEFNKINPMFMVFFSIMFTIALAGVWEMWEFSTDKLFGLQSQRNSLIDTMTDIICGTIGGLISLIPIYRFAKGKKNKFLSLIINEILDE